MDSGTHGHIWRRVPRTLALSRPCKGSRTCSFASPLPVTPDRPNDTFGACWAVNSRALFTARGQRWGNRSPVQLVMLACQARRNIHFITVHSGHFNACFWHFQQREAIYYLSILCQQELLANCRPFLRSTIDLQNYHNYQSSLVTYPSCGTAFSTSGIGDGSGTLSHWSLCRTIRAPFHSFHPNIP